MNVEPKDIKKLSTEKRNPNTVNIDTVSTLETVRLINSENRVLADAVDEQAGNIAAAVDIITDRMQHGGRLIYIGAGTSGRLGILDASECPPTFSVPSDRVVGLIAGGNEAIWRAVEGAEDDPQLAVQQLKEKALSSADVVCAVAASGRTPYTIGALDYAKSVGAAAIAVSNNKDSELGRHADVAIEVETGPEALSGSTRLKAGTAQKLVLNILSTATMVKQGKTYSNLMVDVNATNKKLHARCVNILREIFPEREEAELSQALGKSNGSVKLAAVMLKRGVDADEAKKLLDVNRGYLRAVFGERR